LEETIYDMVADLSLTIEETKFLMASMCHREPFEVRLRRSTPAGKAGHMIEDEALKLVSLALKPSELLFLETSEGQAKGFITFNVHAIIDDSEEKKENAGASEVPVCPFRFRSSQFTKVGQFKLSPDQPVVKIKEEIIKVGIFENAPSIHNIRASKLSEYMQPVQVFRKNDISLKKAGLSPGSTVNILGQLIDNPLTESRRTLLRIFVRHVDVKEYHPPGGIYLDFDTSLPISDLKKAISPLVDLKGEHMALAAYVMNKYQWKNLDGSANPQKKPSNTKKKKKAQGRDSLMKKLTDFSVIGVKDRRKDPNNNDTWKTDYDKYVNQLIASGAAMTGTGSTKKLGEEKGVVIIVDVDNSSEDDDESSGME
jgi:hypothetical protein